MRRRVALLLSVMPALMAVLPLATPVAADEPATATATVGQPALPPGPEIEVDDTLMTPPYVEVQPTAGQLRTGSPARFTAFFFAEGKQVSFFIDSMATPIGRAVAAPVGRPEVNSVVVPAASLITSLPRDLNAGRHRAIALGPNIDGVIVEVTVVFEVQAAAVSLPRTGSNVDHIGLVGAGCATLGTFVLALGRRPRARRRHARA